MKWLHKCGEHARAVAAIIALGAMLLSGAAFAARSYIRNIAEEMVAAAVGDFRTEWRCSEWEEELEKVLNQLADMEEETTAERTRLELRRDRLRELIRENSCARYDV